VEEDTTTNAKTKEAMILSSNSKITTNTTIEGTIMETVVEAIVGVVAEVETGEETTEVVGITDIKIRFIGCIMPKIEVTCDPKLTPYLNPSNMNSIQFLINQVKLNLKCTISSNTNSSILFCLMLKLKNCLYEIRE